METVIGTCKPESLGLFSHAKAGVGAGLGAGVGAGVGADGLANVPFRVPNQKRHTRRSGEPDSQQVSAGQPASQPGAESPHLRLRCSSINIVTRGTVESRRLRPPPIPMRGPSWRGCYGGGPLPLNLVLPPEYRLPAVLIHNHPRFTTSRSVSLQMRFRRFIGKFPEINIICNVLRNKGCFFSMGRWLAIVVWRGFTRNPPPPLTDHVVCVPSLKGPIHSRKFFCRVIRSNNVLRSCLYWLFLQTGWLARFFRIRFFRTTHVNWKFGWTVNRMV